MEIGVMLGKVEIPWKGVEFNALLWRGRQG